MIKYVSFHLLRLWQKCEGCFISENIINIKQGSAWISIDKDEVWAFQYKNISHIVIHTRKQERIVINLFKFSHSAHDRALNFIQSAVKKNA